MANVIELKVNQMAEKISSYIIKMTTEERFKKMNKHAFYLSGAPGVGKSQGVQEIKRRVEEATGKTVNITDLRLLLCAPTDLRGIPFANEDKTKAVWLRPEMFDMDPSEDVINFLFLDELSAAAPSVQAAAYQITLERRIGEHQLPDNCFGLAAGNRLTDKSVATRMPKALANRLTHFDIIPDLEDWKQWAYKKGVDSRIVGFLNFKPSLLNKFDPSTDDNAFPTPRAWETVNDFIDIYGGIEEAFECIAGTIGLGAAGEFKRYCQVFMNIPNVDDVFAGNPIKMPTQPDILYALSAAISGRSKGITKKQMENVLKFTMEMPQEFAVLTVKDMLLVDGVKNVMITCKAWSEWSKKMRQLIL